MLIPAASFFSSRVTGTKINMHYAYDSGDLSAILSLYCSAFADRYEKTSIELLNPICFSDMHAHLSTVITSSLDRRKKLDGKQCFFVIPVLLEDLSWSAFVITKDPSVAQRKIVFINARNMPFPSGLSESISSQFQAYVSILAAPGLPQANIIGSGPMLAENILRYLSKQLKKDGMALLDDGLQAVRLHHIFLMSHFFSELRFHKKQERSLSQHENTLLLDDSLSVQLSDMRLSLFPPGSMIYQRKFFSPSTMDQLEARARKILLRLPRFSLLRPEDMKIRRISGGSNVSFKLSAQGAQYFLRIARRFHPVIFEFFCFEGNNIWLLESLRLGAKFFHFDAMAGLLLTEFVKDKESLPPDTVRYDTSFKYLYLIVASLRTLHDSGINLSNTVNVFERVRKLFFYLEAEILETLYDQDFSETYSKLLEIEVCFRKLQFPLVPCHNDPSPWNCLITPAGLSLIDWERSGNNDPAWDLAYLSDCANLDAFQEGVMFGYYHVADDDTFRDRMTAYKPIISFWKSLWLIFQAYDGNDILPKEFFINAGRAKLSQSQEKLRSAEFLEAFGRLSEVGLHIENRTGFLRAPV